MLRAAAQVSLSLKEASVDVPKPLDLESTMQFVSFSVLSPSPNAAILPLGSKARPLSFKASVRSATGHQSSLKRRAVRLLRSSSTTQRYTTRMALTFKKLRNS